MDFNNAYDNAILRASHAALVEAVKNVLVIQTPETLLNLSDALAAVGG